MPGITEQTTERLESADAQKSKPIHKDDPSG
jgi:hypothetical protein